MADNIPEVSPNERLSKVFVVRGFISELKCKKKFIEIEILRL